MRIMWFQVEMLKQRNFLLAVTWNEKKKDTSLYKNYHVSYNKSSVIQKIKEY